jgi:hypothetical protein
MRPNVYEFALWILSSGVLAASTIIIIVSLVAPRPIHPSGLPIGQSPSHQDIRRSGVAVLLIAPAA